MKVHPLVSVGGTRRKHTPSLSLTRALLYFLFFVYPRGIFQGSRVVLKGGVEPLQEGIEPGDLVFIIRESRHRTFRRLTDESPHLVAEVTVRPPGPMRSVKDETERDRTGQNGKKAWSSVQSSMYLFCIVFRPEGNKITECLPHIKKERDFFCNSPGDFWLAARDRRAKISFQISKTRNQVQAPSTYLFCAVFGRERNKMSRTY